MSHQRLVAISTAVIKIWRDLSREDFIEFKQYLQKEALEGFPIIPKSQLEKGGVWFTKSKMMRRYNKNMIKITRRVLKRVCQHELGEKLSKLTSAGTKREK